MRHILNLIAKHESGGIYNRVYGAGMKTEPITSMTINEVIDWQRRYTTTLGSPSSAAGRYQIIRKTLKGLVSDLKLDGSELFNEEMQDIFGQELLRRRGYNEFLSGKIKQDTLILKLSKEWASFPVPYRIEGNSRFVSKGESYYAGVGTNKAHASYFEVLSAIKSDKLEYDIDNDHLKKRIG